MLGITKGREGAGRKIGRGMGNAMYTLYFIDGICENVIFFRLFRFVIDIKGRKRSGGKTGSVDNQSLCQVENKRMTLLNKEYHMASRNQYPLMTDKHSDSNCECFCHVCWNNGGRNPLVENHLNNECLH